MKRYDLEETGQPFESDRQMVEHPNGEWVRWEDYKRQMEKLEVELLKIQSAPKCNCEEMASKNWTIEVEGDTTILKGYWICPVHGYKRR